MSYNVSDIVKVRFANENELCQITELRNGYIIVKSIITSATYVVMPEMIIKNITEEVEEGNKNNCLAESLAAALKCDRCSNSVIITCTQKSNEERLREENEKLKKELELAKKSEKHLEICENALLEKDAEIERLKKLNLKYINRACSVYNYLDNKFGWDCDIIILYKDDIEQIHSMLLESE